MKNSPIMRQLVALALTALTLTALGCSSEERRYRLSGNVTYKGQPVAEGYVVMEPDSAKGGKGDRVGQRSSTASMTRRLKMESVSSVDLT